MFLNIPFSLSARQKELKLSDGALLVYGALVAHCTDKEQCWPSQERLGEITSRSARAVRSALEQLRGAGLVRVQQRKHQSAVYTVVVPKQLGTFSGQKQDRKESSAQENKTGSKTSQDRKETSYRRDKEKTNTTTPPTPPPHQEAREREDVALSLVKEWDRRFPLTTPGCDRIADQLAFIRLMRDHGKTPQDLNAYIDHTEQNGVEYCMRPAKLLGHSGGNGPYRFTDIDARIAKAATKRQAEAAKAGPSLNDTLADLRGQTVAA